VGFSVITRQGKKMVLTPGGRKLARLSKTYSKRFDDLISEIQQEKNKIIGGIALGTMFGLGKSWVAHRMIEFAGHFDHLSVKVQMDFPDKLIQGFELRDYDCLILPSHLTPAHSESKILHTEMATLVFPDRPEFNITSKSSLKEILDFPLIFFEDKDPLFYIWCREKYGQVPRSVAPRLVINAFGQMLQAVHEGLGVAVIPTHVFKRSYFKDKVKTLGKKFDIQSSVFNFIYHAEDKDALKIDTVYNFLLKEVENLNI
ncbi:MAG: LysR family transcriptional regulator, partial [Bacteriovoracaceae bacterium]